MLHIYYSYFSTKRPHIDISNYILCINSYAESSPWSNRMISTVSEYVQKNPKLALYAEHMTTLMIDNDTILGEFKNMISQKYEHHRPRLSILLGNPSLLLRDKYRELWGDIPIVLCSEEKFIGPKDTYIYKQPITQGGAYSGLPTCRSLQSGAFILKPLFAGKYPTDLSHNPRYEEIHVYR